MSRENRKVAYCTCGIKNNKHADCYHETTTNKDGFCIYCGYAAAYGLSADNIVRVAKPFDPERVFLELKAEDAVGNPIRKKRELKPPTAVLSKKRYVLLKEGEAIGEYFSMLEAAYVNDLSYSALAKSRHYKRKYKGIYELRRITC